jgi:acyl-CoA hydrolase
MIEELKDKSETRIFKAVFPNTTNHYDTLFGGTALHLLYVLHVLAEKK